MNWEQERAIADALAAALTAIGTVVAGVVGTTSGLTTKAMAAADAIQVIQSILAVVQGVHEKRVPPEIVKEALDKLLGQEAVNDAAAQAAIDKKFGD